MNKPGFSLIEALVALILIGLAVVALVGSNSAFTKANGAGAELSTSEFLIEQIRELTTTLSVVDPQSEYTVFGPEEQNLNSYDDIDDFDDAGFCPPIAADRTVLSDLSAYRQDIVVENVSGLDLDQVLADKGSDFVRVTVTVSLSGKPISSASWLRTRYP